MRTHGLTDREWQVAELVADGLTDRAIAFRLGLSWRTVDFHLRRIGRRWELGGEGMNKRSQIVRRVLEAKRAA